MHWFNSVVSRGVKRLCYFISLNKIRRPAPIPCQDYLRVPKTTPSYCSFVSTMSKNDFPIEKIIIINSLRSALQFGDINFPDGVKKMCNLIS